MSGLATRISVTCGWCWSRYCSQYVRIATPPFENPAIPTHFAVRACQAGLSRNQLIHRFRRHGARDDDLFTDVEAAQSPPQSAQPVVDEGEDVPLLQLSTRVPTAVVKLADATPRSCRNDGEQQMPLQFERSLPGVFRNHAEAVAHNVLPSWTADMHEAFADYAAVELDEEGPIGYVDTWLLRGHRA